MSDDTKSKLINKDIKRALGGFISGIAIAFVCINMLPTAFYKEWIFFGVIGIVCGVCSLAYCETTFQPLDDSMRLGIMLIAVTVGIILGTISSPVTAFIVAFIGGGVIYTACGYAVPEKEHVKTLAFSAISSEIGLLTGYVLCNIWKL